MLFSVPKRTSEGILSDNRSIGCRFPIPSIFSTQYADKFSGPRHKTGKIAMRISGEKGRAKGSIR
jgi:hypothetical protein